MNDDGLDSALGDLAREDAMTQTPPEVEARTLAAFDTWVSNGRAMPVARRPGRRWVGAAAAMLAASGLLALVLPRPLGPPPSSPPPSSIPSRQSEAAAPAALAAIPARIEPLVQAGPAPRRQRSRRPAGIEGAVESAAFTPLTPDVETGLSGSFQLSRVRVPRDVLVDLGLLVDAHRGGESVTADVVFGEDGLARAIRLAPVSRRIP